MTKIEQDKHIYSVSELTQNIKFILEEAFSGIWVEGEVSNLTKHQSGHMYFSIKDKESVLACVLFRGAVRGIKFEIESGMKLLCRGRISVYNKRGQYQLYVDSAEPKGVGALQVAFEKLKEKLYKEGLFDESIKKEVPYLPSRIGVITSPTGAAIKDILNVAKRRFSNIEIILNPVRVQGDAAKDEIVDALELFNALGNVEVIILGRGGGSIEDLWPFNEEIVARAIRNSKIPVISAVGHEIDWTISDFVSDFRAPTPSAAAELVIPKKDDLVKEINSLAGRLRLPLISGFQQRAQELDDLASDLSLKGTFFVSMKNEALKNLAGKLETLSPLNILGRGYSITTAESGKVVKKAKDLKRNDTINTKLSKGEIVSKVTEIRTEG